MKKKISDALSIVLVFVLVYAAASKIMSYDTFVIQVKQSPILSRVANALPWMVLLIEVLISVLLMISRTRLFGLYACFMLLVIFTAYIYVIMNFMDNIPCSCGGIIEKLTWGQHLVFNIGLILMTVVSVYLYKPSENDRDIVTAVIK